MAKTIAPAVTPDPADELDEMETELKEATAAPTGKEEKKKKAAKTPKEPKISANQIGVAGIAEQLGITKIDISANGGHIEFSPETPVQAISIIQMMQKHPTFFRMDGGQRLKVMVMLEDYQKRIQFIIDLLDSLLKEIH